MATSAPKGPPSSATHSTPNWRRAVYIMVPLAAIAGLAASMLRPAPAAPAPLEPRVTVASPLAREVDQWDDYVGRFVPSKAVEVRPRVSGAIVAIHFQDGQTVAQGQRLFTIDPRPYRSALAEARAGVGTAVSALELARSDYERASRLQGDDAIAAGELDALHARLRAAQAGVAAARARAETRALDLEFTEVRAPIAGRISYRRIDIGNLVAATDGNAATLLTTIYALDPIYFSFDASEALFLKAKRQQSAAGASVEIRLQDESGYRWKGKLDFTDNTVDPRSGTIRGRATIANPDQLLTPGMFGNMRMASGSGPALLIPDAAVQTDQADKTVLLLGPNDTVITRKVVLGPLIDGLRVIAGGLEPTDRVIIGGAQMAATAAKVQPQTGTIATAAATTAVATRSTLASN